MNHADNQSFGSFFYFLGPRESLVLPLVDPSARPCARQIWITYIQAFLPYESSEDSSYLPDDPIGSPRRPHDPWDPLAPLIDPLGSLKGSLDLNKLLRSPQLPHKSSEDPSYVLWILWEWDILPLPIDPLGPCRPTP